MSSPVRTDPPPTLTVALLGRFSVTIGERTVPPGAWRLRKARSLLKLLALAPDHRLHRDQLVDALWPGLPPARGDNNLRKALHVARRALGTADPAGEEFLLRQDAMLLLGAPGRVRTDVRVFEDAAATARERRDPEAYRHALGLYTADLLPEDRYERWAGRHADRLRAGYLDLHRDLAALLEARGELEAAAEMLERAASLDPLHEDSCVALMRLHARLGARVSALRAFDRLAAALRADLGTEPLPATRRLHDRIRRGEIVAEPAPAPAADPGASSEPPPLVGRDTEVERIAALLDEATAGRVVVAFVGGEAGIGKSRLLGELAARAAARRVTVLRGAAYDGETRLPFGPFVEALDACAAKLGPDRSAAWLAALPPELLDLLPSVPSAASAPSAPSAADPAPTTPEGGVGDRPRLFAAIARVFRLLTAGGPALLTLDDLHAADGATVELLHYLARTGADLPLVVVAAFRAEEADTGTPLGRTIAALGREQLCTRLDLGPLSAQQAAELVTWELGPDAAPAVAAAIHELARGNPFYTVEAARAVRAEASFGSDRDPGHRDRGLPLPRAVRELVASRVARLTPAARSTLDLLAVMGREAPMALLERLTDLPHGDLLDAVAACVRAGILEETADGVRFAHPLHREVLYQRLIGARRAFMHGQVAAAIADGAALSTPDAERLAHHLARSDQPARAVPHLLGRAEHAEAVHATELALHLYRQALVAARAGGSEGQGTEAGIQERIGDLEALTSSPVHGLDAFRAALAIREAGPAAAPDDPAAVLRLHRKAAAALLSVHDPAGAESHLAMAEALASAAGDDAERARVRCLRAQSLWLEGSLAEARRVADLSVDLARRAGSATDQAAAYETLAIICHFQGEWRQGLEHEVERLTLEEDAPELARVFGIHHCVGLFHLYGDRSFDSTEDYARRTLQLARRSGARRATAFAWCLLGEALLFRGTWGEAASCLRRSVEVYEALGAGPVALPWQRLAELAVYRGAFDAADDYLRHAMAAAEDSPMARHAWDRIYATATLAALERGDIHRAVEMVAGADETAERRGSCPTCGTLLNPAAAEALAAAGDVDAVERRALAAERAAALWESAAWRAMAESARASVARVRGDHAEARDRLIRAADLFEAADQPFWVARCRFHAGLAALDAGGGAAAGAAGLPELLVRQSLATFERLGAVRAEQAAAAALERVTSS